MLPVPYHLSLTATATTTDPSLFEKRYTEMEKDNFFYMSKVGAKIILPKKVRELRQI